MRKRWIALVAALSVTALLSACGGGGGGGGDTPPTPPPVAKSSAATVSGRVVALSALVSKAAASLDGVAIEVVSYDKADKELGRAAVTTDDKGGFAVQVPLLDKGGYVIVLATKEGFTQFQKRVDYTTPGNIELQAALQGVTVAFANLSSGGALAAGIGKSTEPSFSFAVVRFPNGVKKTVAGRAIRAAKAAGATSELDINIPKSSLPGVASLKGELKTFEPAKESDRFPGSYTGVDKSGKEGKMVSLAFDFMKITNADTGENLGQVAKKLVKSGVRKASDTTTTVTRSIYASSCDNLFIEDYDLTAAGYQVPVWSLNSSTGKWVFIGVGTIVDSSGDVIPAPTKTACGGGDYRLKIMVSNEEFIKSWWNLDHIVFDTPKEVCLKGKFKFTDESPAKNLYLNLGGQNIDYTWARTGNDGTYTLTTVLLNNDNGNKTAKLNYSDENGLYKEVNVTVDDSPASCVTKDVTLPKPCEVSGKILDAAGTGIPSRWVRLEGSNFYRGAATDSTGAFSSLVACNTDINLYLGLSTSSATFNVNGTPVGDETADDAAKATLKPLTAPNIPPYGYVYLSQRSIRNTDTITANISAYDEDGNYPVSYKLDIKSGTAVAKSYPGSINGTTVFSATESISGLDAGDYTVELVLTDSKGASRTIPAGSITVSDGSRAPVVTAYADKLSVNICGANNSVKLYGSAYDPDGDPLSALWSSAGVALTCPGNPNPKTSTTGYIDSACDVTVTGNTTYTYKVDDNNGKTASRNVIVNTYSSAPWVSSLTASPTLVPEDASGNARIVTVTATPNHSDSIDLAGSWTVNDASVTACPDVAAIPSGISATCGYTIPDTAKAGDSFKFRFTASGCGKSGFRETTATYGNAADVNIVIQ
jgi:hypothetical protein